MHLCCSSTLLVACSLAMLRHVVAMPTTTASMTTLKPKLVVDGEEEAPRPMTYHFIVDHRPSTLGQNYYIKPGQVVGSFSLDSKALQVRHEGSKRNISNKLNILFVASPKEEEATQS
ncbi:uncharacterized protein LOC133847206 [Drosophila sulfurigaster albostrigata]|uniref:uncharacterized protein LOC133847206 n=1 Tax=Drosophila sulfurigaster albostrigata TaxID=89887 RepID=UPI002D21ADF8|nr:uncharacterized protein LOC133847206 [Drosophila sulfurigaster albostrigata]